MLYEVITREGERRAQSAERSSSESPQEEPRAQGAARHDPLAFLRWIAEEDGKKDEWK